MMIRYFNIIETPFFRITCLIVLAVLLTVLALTLTVTLLLVVLLVNFLVVLPPNRLEIVLVMLVKGFTLLATTLPMAAVAAPITLPTVPATAAPVTAPPITAAAPASKEDSEEEEVLLEEKAMFFLPPEPPELPDPPELPEPSPVAGAIWVGLRISPGCSVTVSRKDCI